MDMLDVEFEWFDPQPEHDFHGLKTLLRQLFDVDASLLDLSALTDLILSQPLLGSTVKVEGNESDPFAFLTVLNLHEHRVGSKLIQNMSRSPADGNQEKPVIRDLRSYMVAAISQTSSSGQLSRLFSAHPSAEIGLILTERLINVPAEVVPPMYAMLLEEMRWARDENEPYCFSHYIIISRTYTEVHSSADQEQARTLKKSKRTKNRNGLPERFYFHPEDEMLQKYAMEVVSFDYKKQANTPDSKRAFHDLGIKPQGHVILIEASKLEPAINALTKLLGSG